MSGGNAGEVKAFFSDWVTDWMWKFPNRTFENLKTIFFVRFKYLPLAPQKLSVKGKIRNMKIMSPLSWIGQTRLKKEWKTYSISLASDLKNGTTRIGFNYLGVRFYFGAKCIEFRTALHCMTLSSVKLSISTEKDVLKEVNKNGGEQKLSFDHNLNAEKRILLADVINRTTPWLS